MCKVLPLDSPGTSSDHLAAPPTDSPRIADNAGKDLAFLATPIAVASPPPTSRADTPALSDSHVTHGMPHTVPTTGAGPRATRSTNDPTTATGMHTHTHTHTRARTCTYKHMRMSTYMYTRIRIHVHIHMLMHTRMHIHVPCECATPCCCLLCLHCSTRDGGSPLAPLGTSRYTKIYQEYTRDYNRDTTMNNQYVPVCTSPYQSILVHTSLYWVLLAARPTLPFSHSQDQHATL